MPRLLLLILLAGLAAPAAGQSTTAVVSGQVRDAATGDPLANVHVFVSGSSTGTVSSTDGRYFLTPVPVGIARIIVSRVGYAPQTSDVAIREPGRYRLDAELEPSIVQLGEITVSARRDGSWDRLLQRFAELFVGVSENAASVSILNPEVLTFDEDGDRFVAEASAPLQIENRSMGYLIRYYLHSFEATGDVTRHEGAALFQEMLPSSDAERRAWEATREKAYRGSSRHFLRALFARETREEGFFLYTADQPRPPRMAELYRRNRAAPTRRPQFAVSPEKLLRPTGFDEERSLTFDRFLEVVYTGEKEGRAYRDWQGLRQGIPDDYQHSWITMRDTVLTVDSNGSLSDPLGLAYYGFMAFERLGDLVPREFMPETR